MRNGKIVNVQIKKKKNKRNNAKMLAFSVKMLLNWNNEMSTVKWNQMFYNKTGFEQQNFLKKKKKTNFAKIEKRRAPICMAPMLIT